MSPEIEPVLNQHQQEHLLAFAGELDEKQRRHLLEQISHINFGELARLCASFGQPQVWGDLAKRAEPPPAFRLNDDDSSTVSRAAAIERGEAALAAGQVALVLVAGGQGTDRKSVV